MCCMMSDLPNFLHAFNDIPCCTYNSVEYVPTLVILFIEQVVTVVLALSAIYQIFL